MPASNNPIFVTNPLLSFARITAANTSSNGDGTMFQLMVAGETGSRVDGVRFRNSQNAVVASTAMVHRIFYSPTNQSGSANGCRLIGEVITGTATRSNTAIGATSIYTFDLPIFMPSGSGLFVAQSAYTDARDQFDAHPFAGSY